MVISQTVEDNCTPLAFLSHSGGDPGSTNAYISSVSSDRLGVDVLNCWEYDRRTASSAPMTTPYSNSYNGE